MGIKGRVGLNVIEGLDRGYLNAGLMKPRRGLTPMAGKEKLEAGKESWREEAKGGTATNLFLAAVNESSGEIVQAPIPRRWLSRNIVFVPFNKGIQRRKNTFHIHKVNLGLNAVAPMVFAKVLPKELVDVAG